MSVLRPRLSGAPRPLCAFEAEHSDQNNHSNTDKKLQALLCLWQTPFLVLTRSSLLSCLCQTLFGCFSVLRLKQNKKKPSCVSPCLNRTVPCSRRRGGRRHAESTSFDAPSVSRWRHTLPSSTASCPPRAVSVSLRTPLCSSSPPPHTHTVDCVILYRSLKRLPVTW